MIISPNLGEMGAPQLGHLSAVAPKGAKIGDVGTLAWSDCELTTFVPHFIQKIALSGSWVPHLRQNIIKVLPEKNI